MLSVSVVKKVAMPMMRSTGIRNAAPVAPDAAVMPVPDVTGMDGIGPASTRSAAIAA